MKITIVSTIAFIVALFITSCAHAKSNDTLSQFFHNDSTYPTLKELKGAWKLVSVVKISEEPKTEVKKDSTGAIIIESNREIAIPEPTGDYYMVPELSRDDYYYKPRIVPIEASIPSDWIYFFKGDSLYEISYPCKLYLTGKFELKKDSLKIHYSKTLTMRYKLSYLNDTLTITGSSGYGVRKFVRADVDTSVVEIITSNSFNPLCLEGNWLDYRIDMDGSMKPLKFGVDTPFKIPYAIAIKRENMNENLRLKKMTFRIDGKDWDFNYSLRVDDVLELELLNWKKEDGSPLLLLYQKE